MTPSEMVEHLDRRFKLLTAGRRTAVTRHQTLRSTIDWSYDLLEEAERAVLRRLSVFPGDFDLSSAEPVVAGDDLDTSEVSDLLFRLVEKSLVVADASSGVTRYRMLETVRDYAWERMAESGEGEGSARRHCVHFLEFADDVGPDLKGGDELPSKERVNRELDNLRAALRWAIDAGEAEIALRLVDSLAIVGLLHAVYGTVPQEAANMPGADGNPLVAVALASAAEAFIGQGENQQAVALAEAALNIAHGLPDTPLSEHILCRVCSNVSMVFPFLQNGGARSEEMARVWLKAARKLDDAFEISEALTLLGGTAVDPQEAVQACEEALALAHRVGSPSRIAYASTILATRLGTADVDRVEALFAEALDAALLAHNDWVDSFTAQALALMQARRGDFERAIRTLVETAERANQKGDHFALGIAVRYLAIVLAALGDEEAALLLGSWSEARAGVSWGADTHPVLTGLDDRYSILVSRQSASERELLTRQVAGISDAQAIAIARRHIDRGQ